MIFRLGFAGLLALLMLPYNVARQLHQVESSMTAYYTSSADALARDRARYLRSHVNDLDALLNFAVDGHVVTVTIFNKGYREFAAVGALETWHCRPCAGAHGE